jgi:hypothetical protein
MTFGYCSDPTGVLYDVGDMLYIAFLKFKPFWIVKHIWSHGLWMDPAYLQGQLTILSRLPGGSQYELVRCERLELTPGKDYSFPAFTWGSGEPVVYAQAGSIGLGL